MEKRRYGRTGHMSTVAVFGAACLGQLDQPQADKAIQKMIDAGVNHIDIAPSYGQAEARMGPWMPDIREDFFLGCKTTERSKTGAMKEFQESLERLQTDHFDLYQLHAVTTMDELDQCTAPGGALEGVIGMRDQGLTDYIGITGHGMDTPKIFIEALSRFDFDSVLFPLYPTLLADDAYRQDALKLLDLCEEKDVGVMTIKSVAKEPWDEREHSYHTWYVPFDDQDEIQDSINFVLSHKLTHICTPGDYRLLDKVFKACENFEAMRAEQQEALIKERAHFDLIF
ncbi:MAG: aldo/keto reductase [Chloroflexota bacterium]|jgi:aryl-alcohol dehydrogenase-like predicted oxidoreductase|nr:aldo/keto reductase [Chloroflexota bacterium]